MRFGRIAKWLQWKQSEDEPLLQDSRGLEIDRQYQDWIETWEFYAPARDAIPRGLLVSIGLVGEPATAADEAYWSALPDKGSNFQVLRASALHAGAFASLVSQSKAQFVLFASPSDRLGENLAQQFSEAMQARAPAALIFGDEDQIDSAGRRYAPWFKPDFGDDLFLCQNGFGRSVFFRKSDLAGIRMPDAPDIDTAVYAMALEVMTSTSSRPLHCPGVLLHIGGDPRQTPDCRVNYLPAEPRRPFVEAFLSYRGTGAEIETSDHSNVFRLRHPLPERLPLVSIVIPTRDRKDLLSRCIASLDELTSYRPKEIVVVDNGSIEAQTKEYFSALSEREDVRIVNAPGPFNYSNLINLGVAQAVGEVIAVLNNDVEAIEPDWLHEMVSQALRPDVGVVGCLLLYPDNTIQHAGVIMGLSGVASHLFRMAPLRHASYAGRAFVAQDLSAVTGACHVMKRSVFERLGGLDEQNLAVAYSDIDFCLRVRQSGLRVIYTPHAKLIHRHKASRGIDTRPERLTAYIWEREYMRSCWARVIFDDPFFNPNLSLRGRGCRLATAPRPRLF